MSDKISRRAIIRGAAVTGLAAAAPLSMAQQSPDDPGLDRRLDEVEKKLAHPLSTDVKKLARTALKNLEQECADRLKTKLPENSEPCFTYIPTEPKKKPVIF